MSKKITGVSLRQQPPEGDSNEKLSDWFLLLFSTIFLFHKNAIYIHHHQHDFTFYRFLI